MVEQTVPDANTLSFSDFVRLANDFHLVQRVGSMYDLGVYFRASAHQDKSKAQIDFSEFLTTDCLKGHTAGAVVLETGFNTGVLRSA